MTFTGYDKGLNLSGVLDSIRDATPIEHHRALLATCAAALDLADARELLDALGLNPVRCEMGHGIRRGWCKPCRERWPEAL